MHPLSLIAIAMKEGSMESSCWNSKGESWFASVDWSPKRRVSSDWISLRMEYRGASLRKVYRDFWLMIV
ncbi:unk1-68aa [Fowl aviadenovirus 4]|nr:unk1-68aa [Fowl aviadenovirus 4]